MYRGSASLRITNDRKLREIDFIQLGQVDLTQIQHAVQPNLKSVSMSVTEIFVPSSQDSCLSFMSL